MKRDMDLVRSILLQVEERSGPSMEELLPADRSVEELERYAHHTRILIDAGFLTGIDASSMDGPDWLDLQLSWPGHEFLSTLRDPTVWQRAKGVAEKAGGASFQVLLEVGKAIIIEAAKGIVKLP